MIKFICIQDVKVEFAYDYNSYYHKYFIIGAIYDFKINSDYIFKYTLPINNYSLTEKEINTFFIRLDQWRNQQINKILNG